jgi:hypothetical protein
VSHYRNSSLSTGIVLLVLLVGFSSSVLATNMYETHGYDYEFNGGTLFPVAWDLRGAWFEYRDFVDAYYPAVPSDAYADGRISGILEDALDAGINTVIIRKEGWMDAENFDSRTDSPTHYLEDRADLIRSLGLNVVLGGFGDILDDQAHNEDVQDFIEDYIGGMSTPPPSGWGNVIGIHGFDEPDGRYDYPHDPNDPADILIALEDYHDWSNDLGVSYPFGCFMAKPAMYVPTLLDPNIGTGTLNNTIEDLCDRQDFPMLDWYPCRTWGGTNSGISITSADVWGATDLLPTSNASNFYDAYCTRDEVWTIDRDASASPAVTTFKVYEVTDEGQMGGVDLDFFCDEEVDVVWPFETASSDYRASDIGDRSGGYHDLNGAVVMYRQDDDVDEAQVVFHNGTDLILTNMPNTQVTEDTHFYCVGEQDYRVSSQFADREGILGTAGLRILWCGEGTNHGNPVTRVRIFEKVGNNIVQEGSLELIYDTEDFTPVGAVWGYFWTDSWPLRRSGFVLYDLDGQYVVVHQDGTSGHWEAVGTQLGTPFTGLFNGKTNPSVLFAYRQTTWPADHFTPARDLLLSVVDEPMIEGFLLQWRAGTGSGWSLDHPSHMHFDAEVGSADIEQASFTRVWDGNKTRFYFNGSNMNGVYNVVPFDPGWEDVMNDSSAGDIGDNASPWGLMNMPMRARHTRTPWVNTLLYYRNLEQGAPSTVSIRSSIIIDNNESNEDTSFASIDLYFQNLCSEGADVQSTYATSTDQGAFDLEFQYGIPETENGGDCLFANVQAFGRYQQENATFMPSHDTGGNEPDTLLYMTVAPIVHGCRGISFYALDMALLCGSPGQSYMPDRLLNWAPSRDSDSNGDQDMIERVNDVVKMLTGGYGGPDFLDALVDHDNWTVLDDQEATNATWETYGDDHWESVEVEQLNFIALMNDNTEDIILIVSNDYPDLPCYYEGSAIWFEGLEWMYYEDPVCFGGFDDWSKVRSPQSHQETIMDSDLRVLPTNGPITHGSESAVASVDREVDPALVVDFGGMLPYSVSLLFIEKKSAQDASDRSALTEEIPVLLASRDSNGDIEVHVSGYHGACELVVYDLTGRIVSELYNGELSGGGMNFTIGSGELSRGVYFATITQNGEMVGVQRILMY